MEAKYWALVQSGLGSLQACRQVGITRWTGYRWRAEVGGVTPARLADAVRSHWYLSLLKRQRTAALHRQGVSVREVGRRLDRNASTISRELRRNTAAHDGAFTTRRWPIRGLEPAAPARAGPGWRLTEERLH